MTATPHMYADLAFDAIWWATAVLMGIGTIAVLMAGDGNTARHVLRDRRRPPPPSS